MGPWIVGGIFALVAAIASIGSDGSGDSEPDLGDGKDKTAVKSKLKSKRPQGAQESFIAGQKAGREARDAELVIETKARDARQAEIDSAVKAAMKASAP